MSSLSITQIHALPHTIPQLTPSTPSGISVHPAKISSSLRRYPLAAATSRRSMVAIAAAGTVTALLRCSAKASTAEQAFVKKTVSSHDIVIFSKSYCPYCATAKSVFKELKKVPYVVELDKREDGQDIQDALDQLVGRRTVPQVFVKGEHLGGSDDTVEAYQSGRLGNLLAV